MRLLFTSFPAKGHFHPMAPLAKAAQAAGHEVRVASGPDLAAWAGQCGFDAVEVGLTQLDATRQAQHQFGDAWQAHLFTDVWVRSALPGLLEICAVWRPDVVTHEEEEYAAPLLADLLGLRCVTHSWHAPARPREGRDEAVALLAQVWAEHAPQSDVRRVGELYLDACPPPMQTEQIIEIAVADGGPDVVRVRPVPFDGAGTGRPPAWLAALPRPAVYVTLGTVAVFSTPALLRTVVDAVSPLAAAVVVTTGPNPVGSLGRLPQNVHAEPYLPQSLVLGHVDLVVSQGGAGGTLGAIEHGLPHLMLPGDSQSQQSAAAAIDALGAGRALGRSDRDVPNIRSAASELLGDPSCRSAAAAIRAQLQTLPGPDEVVVLVTAPGLPH
jgi:UDP:flavonoid glycosyltransferase YjiC (YdhE family)